MKRTPAGLVVPDDSEPPPPPPKEKNSTLVNIQAGNTRAETMSAIASAVAAGVNQLMGRKLVTEVGFRRADNGGVDVYVAVEFQVDA